MSPGPTNSRLILRTRFKAKKASREAIESVISEEVGYTTKELNEFDDSF